MHNIAIGLVILSATALFFLSWFKLCILDDALDGHSAALLLIIFGACTIGGDVVLPQALNDNWDLIGQASLILGIYVWIIIDRRRL